MKLSALNAPPGPLRGQLSRRRIGWGLAAGATVAAGAWWFGDRAPYPYAQHGLLDIQLPFLTSGRLGEILAPRPGERMLEIGPGTGLQSLHVAPQLGPDGQLDVLDIQPEMLDHVSRRAVELGVANVVATRSDARELPFEDGSFDAVYMVTALGEIPDPDRVLREVARVLSPNGRLVVGEFFDRHWLPFSRLHRLADEAGLHLDMRRGPTVAYLARFRTCTGSNVRSFPESRAVSVSP